MEIPLTLRREYIQRFKAQSALCSIAQNDITIVDRQ